MSDPVTSRTGKFMANDLLQRKQMVPDILNFGSNSNKDRKLEKDS